MKKIINLVLIFVLLFIEPVIIYAMIHTPSESVVYEYYYLGEESDAEESSDEESKIDEDEYLNDEILLTPEVDYGVDDNDEHEIDYDAEDDIDDQDYESIVAFSDPVNVATHAALLNAVSSTPAGTSRTIVLTANFTGSGPITIDGGRQITVRSSGTQPFTFTQTTGRHFNITGAGSSLTIENIILCGGNLGETIRGGVSVNSNAVFAMNAGSIIRNGAANHGGGVLINGSGTFNFNGGIIENNFAINQGGGVSIQGGSIFNFNGGLVSNNESRNEAGGIIAWGDGTRVNIASQRVSTISGNRSGASCGGFRLSSSVVVNIDGILNVTNNHATNSGGGVSIVTNAIFNVNSTGIVNVQNNSASASGAGININNGILNIDGQSNVTNNTSIVAGGGIFVSGAQARLNTGISSVVNITGNTATGNIGGGINIMGGILVFDGQLNINNNTSSTSGGGININSGTLTLNGATNIIGNTATINSGSGGGINVSGGAVYVNAPLNVMNNETMRNSGGSLFSGGGIAISNSNSSFTTNTGGVLTLNGNRASGSGGGIQFTSGSLTFNESVVIENNTAGSNGGGLNLSSGSFSNNDHITIRNNAANTSGGGIYLVSNQISLRNMTITNNTASAGGGIGRVGTAALTLADNIEISNNTATNNGGGIHLGVFTNSSLLVPATATNIRITGNHAENNGGAIYTTSHNTNLTLPSNAFANLQFHAPVHFSNNTAGNGASLPPQNATDFANIRYASTSVNGHPFNNYDIVYTPDLPLLIRVTNDGTSPISTRIAHGTSLTNAGYLADLEQAGFRFLGWFTDEELTTPVEADITMPRIDEFEVFAGWQAIGSLNFNLGGTTEHPVNSEISNITDIDTGTRILDLMQNFQEPSRIQHRFTGWFIDSQQTIPLSETHLITAATTTVYAGWIEIADLVIELGESSYFEINYNVPTRQTLDVGTNIYDVVNSYDPPVKDHHNFVGWYLDAGFTMPLVATSELPSGGITVYANWERVQITFTVNIMGEYIEITADCGLTLLAILDDVDTYVTGYIFKGWYIEVVQPFFFRLLSSTTLIPITDEMLVSAEVGNIVGRWEPIPTDNNVNNATPDNGNGHDNDYNTDNGNDESDNVTTNESRQTRTGNNLPQTGISSQHTVIIILIIFWLAVVMSYIKKWKYYPTR